MPAGAPKKFKRKQVIVDVKYQLRFVSTVFLIVFIVAISSGLVAMMALRPLVYDPQMGTSAPFFTALITVSVTLLIQLLLAIPIVFFVGIRATHRIVGPIKRMQSIIQEIGQGDFTKRIILREGDVLVDIATSINEMAESLHKKYPSPPKP